MNKKNFSLGDWVKAKTVEGELVIGYIEGVNDDSKTAKIRAVQTEQASIAGRTIETFLRSVSALPYTPILTKEDAAELIDLALQTRDEKWFMELTAELSQLEQKSSKRKTVNRSDVINRLNFPHVK
ncbi:IDEAL domain-containing protein [Bacillus sp. SG-1]|uniref:IDEAL domain-containing protein n=1 Tax=Bacillus sp. SG-1 TaxID=161544 RepID=UPI00015438F3|nr:IDEAL domain-containing protein [Bacillus sp. SG-1]EDL66732.1 group-specific protein [Bacillus sp. SG-1]